jgi:hypothetical protein
VPTYNVLVRAPARIKPSGWSDWGEGFFKELAAGQAWEVDRIGTLQAHVTCPPEGEEELLTRLWRERARLSSGLLWFPLPVRPASAPLTAGGVRR